jgi:CheY-like chemotaxis protein
MSERLKEYRDLLAMRSDAKPGAAQSRLDIDLAVLALTMNSTEVRSAWEAVQNRQTAAQSRVDVLLVEDDASMVELVKALLAADNISVVSAESCSEAVLAMRTVHPRLMLIDLGLPDGNGFDLARKASEWRDFPRIPLVAVTASAEKAGEAWKTGFTGFIPKPFEPDTFRTLVNSWLS